MLFFGHLAISIALADATDSDPAAAVAGNLLPDVMDKSAGWVLKLTPSRWLAHGLPFFGVCCLLARRFLPGRVWRGFALGYGSHLVADHWAGGRLPLLAPFHGDRRPAIPIYGSRELAMILAPEVLGLAFLLWRAAGARRTGAVERGGPVELGAYER